MDRDRGPSGPYVASVDGTTGVAPSHQVLVASVDTGDGSPRLYVASWDMSRDSAPPVWPHVLEASMDVDDGHPGPYVASLEMTCGTGPHVAPRVLMASMGSGDGGADPFVASLNMTGKTEPALCWGGGDCGPQFTAILPQFFSDASIQKFHFSPEEKSFPPFAVTRHTAGVCVLICPACHLCGSTLFCFCVPKMSSTSGDSDSGNGKRPVNRGKGQGGQKARYATQISPAAHVHIVRDMEYASLTVLCMKISKCIHGPYSGDMEGRLD